MSLMTGALAVYTDILKTRHVHFYDTIIYCDGQATRFPQEGRLAVRVTAAPAGVERICLEVFGKRCVARPRKGGGGGYGDRPGSGFCWRLRGWAGQTPPLGHGGEPLPWPCHTRRLSLLSLHLHSLSSSTLPPFLYSFLHLSPLIPSFNPLFFIATLYCHYSLLPHLAYQNRPLLKVIHHL